MAHMGFPQAGCIGVCTVTESRVLGFLAKGAPYKTLKIYRDLKD